jgi:hypothetical protein
MLSVKILKHKTATLLKHSLKILSRLRFMQYKKAESRVGKTLITKEARLKQVDNRNRLNAVFKN